MTAPLDDLPPAPGLAWLHRAPAARTLVVSLRGLISTPTRARLHELEDVVARVERADLLTLVRPGAPRALVRAWTRLETALPPLRGVPWGRRPPRPYDLLLVACQEPADLLRLGPLDPWLRRAARSVCVVQEVWARAILRRPFELELLRRFDVVATGCRGSLEALREATGRRARWLAPAVDARRFCPGKDELRARRPIDVFGPGRRAPRTHRALLELAARRGWLYLYSTSTREEVPDPAEHRERLAALARRSRWVLVGSGPASGERAGQQELGGRFVEAAAGGALLLGQPPAGAAFDEAFEQDAVIPLPWNDPDPAAAIDAIDADPDRADAARAANVAGALRRHDWGHRWAGLLEAVGLAPEVHLIERLRSLARAADRIAERAAGGTAGGGPWAERAPAPARNATDGAGSARRAS